MSITRFCLLIPFCLLMASCGGAEKSSDQTFYMPGEFEPHEAVWLGWEDLFPAHNEVSIDLIEENRVIILLAQN